MQITAADWSLDMGHLLTSQRSSSSRLQSWVGDRPRAGAATTTATSDGWSGSRPAADAASALTDRLARRARLLQATAPRIQAQAPPSPAPAPAKGKDGDPAASDQPIDPVQLLLEKIFGIKHIARLDMRMDVQQGSVAMGQVTAQATSSQGPAGWGMSYDYQETYAESEVLALKAEGTFTTDDGRSFAVSLDYRMERSHVEQRTISLRAGDAVVKDPLMLDLGGAGGGFSGATAPVDLTGSGQPSALPLPKAGGWYLLRDGQVPTTGASLFGPATGQGFQELAVLDRDGNGFVDSGDPGFASLHLWNGQGAPVALATMGVGAIGTQSVVAPFRHADAADTLLGLNRRSGIFLTEDGRAGMVHQVDVA